MKKFLALVLALTLLCSSFGISFAAETTSCANGHLWGLDPNEAVPDGNNNGITEKNVVASTCTKAGSIDQYCTRCQKYITVPQPLADHNPGGALPTSIDPVATCYQTGTAHYAKCVNEGCGVAFTLTVPMTAHKIDSTKKTVVDPTCTEDGYTLYPCQNDGCEYSDKLDHKDKLGHDWQVATVNDPDWADYLRPTCHSVGYMGEYVYCARCFAVAEDPDGDGKDEFGVAFPEVDDVDAVILPMLSHKPGEKTWWENEHNIDFANGFEDEFFVDNADGTTVLGPKALAAYSSALEGTKVLEAKNAESGSYLSVAGDVTITWKQVSCTEDGFVTVKCSCGHYERTLEIKSEGHWYTVMSIEYVDNRGNTRRITTDIKRVYALLGIHEDEINATTDFLDLNLTAEKIMQLIYQLDTTLNTDFVADCTIKPIVTYECCCCDSYVHAEGWACTEHTWGDEEIWMAQLEGELPDGETIKLLPTIMEITQLQVPEYEAVNQNGPFYQKKDQVEVKAKVHEFDDKIAKCTDYTLTVRCAHCAVTKDFPIEGKGHKFDTYVSVDNPGTNNAVIYAPTCEKGGLVVKNCTDPNCGWTEAESINMLPHTPDTTKTKTVAPTCLANGNRTFVCKDCGHEWSETIPTYGHDYEWVVTKEAGCKVKGEEKYICARCGDIDGTNVLPEAHVIAGASDIKAMKNTSWELIHAAATIATNKKGEMIGYNVNTNIWEDCTKDGNLQFTCVNCQSVTITHKAEAAHVANTNDHRGTESKTVFVSDDICRTTTEKTYGCKYCTKTTKVTTTTDKAHTWDRNTATVYIPTATAPTCQKEGSGYYKCECCDSYYMDTIPAFDHKWETKYDAEKACWTFVCSWCHEVEDAKYDAEKYIVDTSKIVWGNKTSGTGYVELEETLNPTFVLGARYAFIQWTWVTKNGDNVVATDVRELKSLGDGEYSFNAKGVSVAGASLNNMVIIITDDADADNLLCKNLGAAKLTK